MSHKRNQETGKEAWEKEQEFCEYGLPPVDVRVMVQQMFDSARRLKACGDYEGAADAATTASLYAADASMDIRFHRAVNKFLEDLGIEDYRRPKFKESKGPSLKNKLLR
jgi:hypothetical protein